MRRLVKVKQSFKGMGEKLPNEGEMGDRAGLKDKCEGRSWGLWVSVSVGKCFFQQCSAGLLELRKSVGGLTQH